MGSPPSPVLRSLLLWLPVCLPLGTGAVAVSIGLPHLPVDGLTVAFLLLGAWGAATGVFSALVLTGSPLARAMRLLALALFTAPAALAVITTVVGLPLAAGLMFADTSPQGIGLVVMTTWYLLAAGLGVEVLDRALP